MKFQKTLMIVGLAAIFFAMSFGSQAYAGGGFDPPAWCTSIQGPELWGVVIMDCGKSIATLRVKRIKDCNVETFSGVDNAYQGTCPQDGDDSVNYAFQGQSFFPDISGSAIITKTKNFQIDGSSISFDAQFKFCAP